MEQKKQELFFDLAEPGAIMAIIMALAEIVKQLGLPARFIPIVDILLGISISLVKNAKEKGIAHSIISGVALGLSSCGAFSGIKNLII